MKASACCAVLFTFAASLGRDGEQPPRDILGSEKALYSHQREELVIRDFFQDRRGGFFLDVGCGHPISDSNTYYLEKHLAWTGIGVDGLPEMAIKWRRNRKNSRFFNFIVTDHSDTLDTFHRAELWDVSSIQRPDTLPGRVGVKSEQIVVRTTTLTDLLDRNRVKAIDLFSIDIEGAEPLALAGFDIDRFQPRLVCVEAKPANREWLLDYFKLHRYQHLERYLSHDLVNYYFRPVEQRR